MAIKFLFNPITAKLDMIDDSVGVPGSPDTSIQFNDGGSFGGTKLLYTEPDTTNVLIKVLDQTTVDEDGVYLTIQAGQANGFGYGGFLNLYAGNADPTGDFGGGGDVNILSGNGGINEDSGYVRLTVGNPGTGGDGGWMQLYGPIINDATMTLGNIDINAGSKVGVISGYVAEGGVRIMGANGNGTNAGPVNIYGGNADLADIGSGTGGDITLTPGQGGVISGNSGNLYAFLQNARGGDSNGGSIDLEASNGFGSGSGGYALLSSGRGGETGDGGDLSLAAGQGGNTSGVGGSVFINSGGSFGNAGSINLNAGSSFDIGNGGGINLTSGQGGATSGVAGDINLLGGTSYGTGDIGANINVNAGQGGINGNGGRVTIRGGSPSSGNASGGDIVLLPGDKAGSGTIGYVKIKQDSTGVSAYLDTTSLASSDKTFTFPNQSGTIALQTGQTYTVSNVTPDRIFDPTSTNLNEVAMVLATLLQDLAGKVNS